MKKLLTSFFRIDSNVYSFISGISLSIAVNIFTSARIDKSIDDLFRVQLYWVSILFTLSSAAIMCIAVKASGIQNFMLSNGYDKDPENKKCIIFDAIKKRKGRWCFLIISMVLTTLSGIVLLCI